MRSRNTRSWYKATNAVMGPGTGTATTSLTRRGTYYFRWSFAGTTSYRRATSAITKVVVK